MISIHEKLDVKMTHICYFAVYLHHITLQSTNTNNEKEQILKRQTLLHRLQDLELHKLNYTLILNNESIFRKINKQ
ncbi:hypothetical protein BAS09_07000 [Elizabethkingia ursingii]|nr:hypothetical protein BAS09_07000 [Elizabethkingia ursingii]